MGANAELVKLMGPQLSFCCRCWMRSRGGWRWRVARAAGTAGSPRWPRHRGLVADGRDGRRSWNRAGRAGRRVRRPGAAARSWPRPIRGCCPRCWPWWRLHPGGPGVAAGVDDQEREAPGRRADRAGAPVQPADGLAAAAPGGVLHPGQREGHRGRRHPDRDAQFRYIAAQAKEHLAAGQPVISVDAKKKEEVGEYAQAGREWRPEGDPVKVRDHSFADEQGGTRSRTGSTTWPRTPGS